MTTARDGRLIPLAAVDDAGHERAVLPFRRSVGGTTGAVSRAADRDGLAQSGQVIEGASSSGSVPPVREEEPDPGTKASVVTAVEHFLAQTDAERRRLEAEIAAAKRRRASVDGQAQLRRKQVEAELGAMALAAQNEVEELERSHRDSVRRILDRAHAEADELVGAARDSAEAMRESAVALARLLSPADEARWNAQDQP